jgi:predicted alpha/beta-hydrolase family hydrolase
VRSDRAAWTIESGEDTTAAVWDPPVGRDGPVFVFAHGAGGHMDDRGVLSLAEALWARGIGTVRFNFFYRTRGGRPDPMPRLVKCFSAVIARVREELHPATLVVGGRSMGGRAASVLVSENAAADGLLLLAYPLHPPGQPEKMRTAHLPAIRLPVLCVNGTRDPFCEPALMERTLKGLGANWRMHWVDGADHSFHVLKRSGRTEAAVLDEIAGDAASWMHALHE